MKLDPLEKIVFESPESLYGTELFEHRSIKGLFQMMMDWESVAASLEEKGYIKKVDSPHTLEGNPYWIIVQKEETQLEQIKQEEYV